MPFVETTAPGQGTTLSFDADLPHPPEKVWRALTDPALVAQWLLPATGLRPEPGVAFTLHTDPHQDWDGTVRCRMLDVDEHRTLSYAWAVEAMDLDTVLTFTLEPTVSGTRLSIVQSGFKPSQKQAFGGARYGWKMMAGKLVDLLARTS